MLNLIRWLFCTFKVKFTFEVCLRLFGFEVALQIRRP